MLCPLSLLLSVGLLFLAQPIDARADEDVAVVRERRGLADYIRAGLGVTTTTTTTATFRESVTAGASSPTSSKAVEDLSSLATCAASWASYSSKATSNVGFTDVTYTVATLVNTTVVYGTGDVYTSYGRIPVVSGSFTPTRTATRLFNVSTTTRSQRTVTSNPALVTETPACSFPPKSCSRLYVSYISSLGLSPNASVPKITPAPANSPQCPDYYYKPFTTSYSSTQSSLTEDCKLYGNSVELFYFPSTTPGEPEPTSPVTYVYRQGTTFTSPSIYLSFDYISATRYIPQSVDAYSVSCGLEGCSTQAVGGGNEVENEGTMITGQILTMAPTDVSSIVLKYDTVKASGIISTVVGGLPGYGDVGQDIHLGAIISSSLTAERLRIEDIAHPPPRAYYLRPEGAPGCGSLVHSPRCGTIFEAEYRAIISLPSQVSGLQGAWATCNPAIYGVYDPPVALTQRASVAKPTLPPGVTPSAYETTPVPTRGAPYTIIPPLATPARTALRDTLPSATSGGSIRPASSPSVPSAAIQIGGSQNGDQPAAKPSSQDQSEGRPNSSSNGGPDGSGSQSGASSNSVLDDSGDVVNPTADETGRATSDGASNGPNTAAAGTTATADRSGTRESSDASSSPSASDSSQSGSTARLPTYGAWSAGAIFLALMF